MGDYEAKRIVIFIGVCVLIWFLFTKADFKVHTGGDENHTNNRTRAIAMTLVGNPSVTVNAGSGASGKSTIICPHCGEEIVIER